MLTAMEIRNQSFSKGMRGFKEDEVKEFLNYVAQDYEIVYSDNAKLLENVRKLEEDLAKYKLLEATMNNSLILAQQTAEAVKEQARREAANMMDEAKKRIAEILSIYQEIIKRLNIFNSELKAQFSGHLEIIEKNSLRIDELTDFFYSSDMKSIMEKLEKIEVTQILE